MLNYMEKRIEARAHFSNEVSLLFSSLNIKKKKIVATLDTLLNCRRL